MAGVDRPQSLCAAKPTESWCQSWCQAIAMTSRLEQRPVSLPPSVQSSGTHRLLSMSRREIRPLFQQAQHPRTPLGLTAICGCGMEQSRENSHPQGQQEGELTAGHTAWQPSTAGHTLCTALGSTLAGWLLCPSSSWLRVCHRGIRGAVLQILCSTMLTNAWQAQSSKPR